MLKDLLCMLEAEMDDHLDIMTIAVMVMSCVTSSMGTMDIPRDKGRFEPQIVKKESDRYLKHFP